MTEIKITGNRQSFQLSKQVDYIEIKLSGNFDFNAKTPVVFSYNNISHKFNDNHSLFQFSEKIRGVNFNQLLLSCLSYGINIQGLTKNNSIENSLLKSIFLIYHWIGLPLTSPNELNLKKQLFNEFVVDWTNKPEPQQDIYFIDEKHCIKTNQSYIDKLIDLNLLARLDIIMSDITYTTFFIPLVKPGVSRELFATASDVSGNLTYNFWQKILEDRNNRISNWVKNRF